MKKVILTAVVMLFAVPFVSAQSSTNVLPQNAQDFISEHFSSETVEKVDEEDGWFSWDKNEMYEVHFSGGLRLDFNKDGEITEISVKDGMTIPESAIPAQLLSHIDSNYPNAEILSWEQEDDKQEIELADGKELEFDLNGKFVKED